MAIFSSWSRATVVLGLHVLGPQQLSQPCWVLSSHTSVGIRVLPHTFRLCSSSLMGTHPL